MVCHIFGGVSEGGAVLCEIGCGPWFQIQQQVSGKVLLPHTPFMCSPEIPHLPPPLHYEVSL